MTEKKLIGWEFAAVRRSGSIRKYKICCKSEGQGYRWILRAWINKQPHRYRLHVEPIYA